MAKRSINELLAKDKAAGQYLGPTEAWLLQGALREAWAFLEDMTKHCHGKRAQRAAELLKKWDEHG